MVTPYLEHTYFSSMSSEIGPDGTEVWTEHEQTKVAIGLWGSEVTPRPRGDEMGMDATPRYGFVFAAVIVALALAAALSQRPARTGSPDTATTARILIGSGAGATVAAAAMLMISISPVLGYESPDYAGPPGAARRSGSARGCRRHFSTTTW